MELPDFSETSPIR